VGCATCIEGTYAGDDGECHECSGGEGPALISLGIVGSIVALGCLSFAVNNNILLQPNATATCGIVMGLTFTGIQTMGAFSNLAVRWAEPLKSLFKALSLLSFDLELLKVECVVGSNAVVNYVCRQLVAPGCAILILAILYLKKRFVKPSLEYKVEAVNTIGFIFQVFFISIVMSATSTFVCYPHPGSAGQSMTSRPSVLCFEDDDHTMMTVVAIIACVLVVLPYLACAVYATLKYPTFVSSGTGKDSSLRMFRFLFFRFGPSTYYFGCVVLLRGTLICLVPMLFRTEAAVQMIAMIAILLSFAGIQQTLQPWRSGIANLVDGGMASLMVLMLACAAMSTSFEDAEDVVGTLGAVIFSTIFLVAMSVVAISIYRRLIPSPFYRNFVCHHKADAAAQARFVQLLLVEKTRQSCFIDSDDLKNLDELFDIVKCRVGWLVVYLTSDTLRRPWCAGEITITFQTHQRLVPVRTPSFRPPSDSELEDVSTYLDLSDTSLVQYGITNAFISEAFKWLLQKQTVDVRADLIGRARIHDVVDGILEASGAAREKNMGRMISTASKSHDDMLVVSSDPNDDEAAASVGILVSNIQESILEFVDKGIYVLADQDDLSRQDMADAVWGARAVVVILTPGSLSSAEQLQAIVDAMGVGDSLPVVPMNTPHFRFPSEQYQDRLMAHFPSDTANEVWLRIQRLFKRISVFFATNASASIIQAQALEMLTRIPRRRERNSTKPPSNDQLLTLEAGGRAGQLATVEPDDAGFTSRMRSI